MNQSLYTRPNKPVFSPVRSRANNPTPTPQEPINPVMVSAETNCFITPPDVAGRMVDYLEADCNMLTLEPSAGTGNLVQALLNNGHSQLELLAIELNAELHKAMRQRIDNEYISSKCVCFLEYAERARDYIEFPRIIMNPPFSKGRAKKHITAAITLLGRGGHNDAVLVALVPSTFKHDEAIELEFLPRDTFAGINVSTKIIRIER